MRRLHDVPTQAPYFPYTGLLVSKRWSEISKGTPEAWRRVFLLFDGSYQDDKTRVRIGTHQRLSKSTDAKMHLDILYEDDGPSQACHCESESDPPETSGACGLTLVLGRPELWRSIRVIVAKGAKAYLDYIINRFLMSKHGDPYGGALSPLPALKELSIVPHMNTLDAAVIGSNISLPILLSRFSLVELTLGNFDHDPETDCFSPPLHVHSSRLRSLMLVSATTEAIGLLHSIALPQLSKLTIIDAEDSYVDEGECVCGNHNHNIHIHSLKAALSSVQSATLDLESITVARPLLRALEGVKHLVVQSEDIDVWPELLKRRYCANLETLELQHHVTFKSIKSIARKRQGTLKSIRVPNTFRVPKGKRIEDIGVQVHRA